MNIKNRRIYIVLLILFFSCAFLHANLARVSALGLVLGETDWMVRDPGNIYYNPAYMLNYNGFIEANSYDNLGDLKPFGSAVVKLSSLFNVGITVGYPLVTGSELNVFRSGKPSDNINKLYFRTTSSSILEYNTLLTPATTLVYNSQATAPFDIPEDLTVNKLMFHFGANIEKIKLGLTVRYTEEGFEDHDTVTDLVTPGNSTTTARAGDNSELGFVLGAIFEKVAFVKELAVDLGFSLPSLSRKNRVTTAGNASFNMREIASDGAYMFHAGFTATIDTSAKNEFLLRVMYSHEDYSIKQTEQLDNDGNGSYFDTGDINIIDKYGRRYDTLLIGVASRLKISTLGFVYLGGYYKYVAHTVSAEGSRGDIILNGPNYTDPVALKLTENIFPVMVGGEFNIASWFAVRFSVQKEFFKSRREVSTVKVYSPGTMNLTSKSENIDSFDLQGNTSLNIGMTIKVSDFTICWVMNKRWISDGGVLSSSGVTSDFDNLSTQFSIAWKFGSDPAKK